MRHPHCRLKPARWHEPNCPVYNLVPFQGVPSMVGFPTSAPGEADPHRRLARPGGPARHLHDRDIHLRRNGRTPADHRLATRLRRQGKATRPSRNGTYLTIPERLRHSADGGTPRRPTDRTGKFVTKSFTTPYSGEGCDKVPFEPTVETTVNSSTDSPDTGDASTSASRSNPSEPIANSYLKVAKVTLPEGMGLNPSVANGLETCTDDQFAYHTNNPIQCPVASEIGYGRRGNAVPATRLARTARSTRLNRKATTPPPANSSGSSSRSSPNATASTCG